MNKLARNKSLSEQLCERPSILKKVGDAQYNPTENPMDLIPSFLICQKLNFDIAKISFNDIYDSDIEYRHRHNFILSLEDGLFAYFDEDKKTYPYNGFGGAKYKYRHIAPDKNRYAHFMIFASFMVNSGSS